jgi:hypothetical protein
MFEQLDIFKIGNNLKNMQEFLNTFAEALTELNDKVPPHRKYCPGIGPYSENKMVSLGVNWACLNGAPGIIVVWY